MSLWEVMVEIIWFMVLVAWFWLLIVVIGDLFRDHGLSGMAKALWCIYLIVLPWVGVLTYLLVRGRSMGERASREAAAHDQAFRAYVRDAASASSGVADELGKLTDMRDRGVISSADYEAAKAQVLGGRTAHPTAS